MTTSSSTYSHHRHNDNPKTSTETTPMGLPSRFAKIKQHLIAGNEKQVTASWHRLLSQLKREINKVAQAGSSIIPTIDYQDMHDPPRAESFGRALRERGVAVIRGVVPANVAASWREQTDEYQRMMNPPDYYYYSPSSSYSDDDDDDEEEEMQQAPSCEDDMFWSPGQIRARADSRVLEAQRFAMNVAWRTTPCAAAGHAVLSTRHLITYADRLHGDAHRGPNVLEETPHIDGGSVERWEPDGYGGRTGTYGAVFAGRWEDLDVWDGGSRLGTTGNLYNSAGVCSAFRMFQGWLALAPTDSPDFERDSRGSSGLHVCPLLKHALTYVLLRPFFGPNNDDDDDEENWTLQQTANIPGALPGRQQDVNAKQHPHLELDRSLIPVPALNAGDYVIWHPDLIHAVLPSNSTNNNSSSSTAMHIPICPLTQTNALFLARQRKTFLLGLPGPDFSNSGPQGGRGESSHGGRPGVQDVVDAGGEEALRSMGLSPWLDDDDNMGGGCGYTKGERAAVRLGNEILFPDRFDIVKRHGRLTKLA